MLNFLFQRLTADPQRGAAMFAAVTGIARRPHWYVEGGVPDTVDGRFAMLSTIAALLLTRLERDGATGDRLSVALTERFVEVMEAEHRELGLGDPTLGKTVLKLVGALARRTELWRGAVAGKDWQAATRESLYSGEVDGAAIAHSAEALRGLFNGFCAATLDDIEQGQFA